jgi:hypothetical protein
MSLQKIQDYVEKYEEMFEELDNNYDVSLPLMYTHCHIVSDNDYYGCDFSKNGSIHMLFYNGSSNFFAGIYVPDHITDVKYDQCPVYIFDLASDEPMELIGNFRTYVERVFADVPKNLFKKAKRDLNKFSDKLETYEYQLIIHQ